WPVNEELRGTAAQHYRGPLTASEVREILKLQLSENARRAITGDHVGYLLYFHFVGHKDEKELARRGRKRVVLQDSTSEKWQCRLCHKRLHIPPGQPSNLGVHLYGSDRRKGCLDLRRHNPVEEVPAPARDEAGKLIRLNA
ncbi:hypothetical protein V8E36_002979, partial [Tilletia maclaganii]